MSKTVLMVIGIVVLLMGLGALTGWWPTWLGVIVEPTWHMWLKVVVGVVAIWVSYADQPAAAQS